VIARRAAGQKMLCLKPRATYRAALAFQREFDLPAATSNRDAAERGINLVHEHARLSLALRLCQSERPGSASGAMHLSHTATTAALAIMESATARGPDGPFAREMGRLLRALIHAINSGPASATMVGLVADSLHRAVPSRAIRVASGQAALIHGTDAVYFDIPSADGGPPGRLLVEFPRGVSPRAVAPAVFEDRLASADSRQGGRAFAPGACCGDGRAA